MLSESLAQKTKNSIHRILWQIELSLRLTELGMNETSRNSFALRSELKPHNKKEIYAQSSEIPDWLTAQHSASFVQSGVPLLHMNYEGGKYLGKYERTTPNRTTRKWEGGNKSELAQHLNRKSQQKVIIRLNPQSEEEVYHTNTLVTNSNPSSLIL